MARYSINIVKLNGYFTYLEQLDWNKKKRILANLILVVMNDPLVRKPFSKQRINVSRRLSFRSFM